MAELVTASDCYDCLVIVPSEGHEFEPHWGSSSFQVFQFLSNSAFFSNQLLSYIYLVTLSTPSILHANYWQR